MENITLTKPKVDTSVIKKITCAKCGKEINQNCLISAFKITMGLIMKHDFIPAEKSVYYHQECL